MLSLALYIHWPFCLAKCPYCDFNSHVRARIDHDAWRAAYVEEMRHYRALTGPRRLTSIFFGGGTPSLMAPATAAAVIAEAARLWELPAGAEITLEANPTSVEAGKLRDFKAAGVNRISLGVQSLRDAALKELGRQHSAAEALAAVRAAAAVFERTSFDLIYARPGQGVAEWRAELEEALVHAGSHLSLYQLTIEEGTAYHTLYQRGALRIPGDELAAEMYETTQEIMERHGLPAYEISNHARPGQESRHNLVYWHYGDYAGVGPGAHGRLTLDGKKWATRAHRAPELWMERVRRHRHGAHPFEEIDSFRRGQEQLLLGLRLASGVALDAFAAETQTPLLRFVHPDRLQRLREEGLLDMTDNTLRVTAAGRLRLNAVLRHLLEAA